MVCRKSLARLTTAERSAFVNGLLALKTSGRYDRYTNIHSVTPAHGTPLFFPWHRQFILDLERDLQSIDPSIALPYWDWSVDNLNGAGTESLIWRDDFMGGPGTGGGWASSVTTGPFAGWGLLRRSFNPFTSPGGGGTIAGYIADPTYNGFRGVEGPHGSAHVWVGGDMGSVPTAPRDPTFFLLHCNVDRLWAEWMHTHASDPGFQPYTPVSGAADPTWNADATMWPWDGSAHPTPIPPWDTAPISIKVSDVLDHRSLGYGYDTIDPECRPKNRFKELKDRRKEVAKELAKERKELRKELAKEVLWEKRFQPDKLIEPEKQLRKEIKEKDKDLVEGKNLGVEQTHFIPQELRPDLALGPLSSEQDFSDAAGFESEEMEEPR